MFQFSVVTPSVSGVVPAYRVTGGLIAEPRRPAAGFGDVMRCWNCGAQIGERIGATLVVNSNKVEVGGIPLVPEVWRRCRGGKSNPACRAVNTVPTDWLLKNRVGENPPIDKQ
jgi:hypothetical protein